MYRLSNRTRIDYPVTKCLYPFVIYLYSFVNTCKRINSYVIKIAGS